MTFAFTFDTYIYMKPDSPKHSSPPHPNDRLDFLLVQTPDRRPDLSTLYSGV